MDERLAKLAESKREKHEQLVAATAGKVVCVKKGKPVVVTAEEIKNTEFMNRLHME